MHSALPLETLLVANDIPATISTGVTGASSAPASNEPTRPRDEAEDAAAAVADPSFPELEDFLRSFEHHFHSGCALKCASFISLASTWYCVLPSEPRAYHHSPSILLTVRLSWLGCFSCTNERCFFEKIMNAFMGRRILLSLAHGLCGSLRWATAAADAAAAAAF